jgi:Tfp pilus assembly protein PilV
MKNFLKNKTGGLTHRSMTEGFLMVEVLVAISIITVSILVAMSVSQKSVYISRQSLHVSQAAFLLEEGAEAVRILRDNNWGNISALVAGTDYYLTFSGGTWILSTTPNVIDIFTRKVIMSNVNRDSLTQDISGVGVDDPQTKLFTISISWIEGGVVITKTLPFYITDLFS